MQEQAPYWWQRGVIYQIYPRSFMDSNNDGVGDLRGIISKLDYFSEVLGIDAIWLSPVYPSPMADFGYDISNFTDIHSIFGSLEDFDTLLAEAHKRNLRIIIDFVPNHSSDQHPWFIESRSSRDNPKHDWYFWADPKPDGSLPNNWLSIFGGPAWEWDETRQQYYLHAFLREQPDLNWRNPEVKAAMFDAVRFWLERGVDGFRLDATHYMMKAPELLDNPPNPDNSIGFKPLGDYDSLLHIYDVAHQDIHEIMREFRALLDSYSAERPRFSVGEIHILDLKKWARYYGENLDELHMPFNFNLIFAPWNPRGVQKVVDAIEQAVPVGGWPNYVLGNHDEHRVASRLGQEGARIAMLLLLTLRGTPTLYYGEEIGMEDVEIAPEFEQDPWGKNVQGMGLGRDPERTPMHWDDSANAGFSAAGVQTWLPVDPNYAARNVQKQLADPRSMLSLTRQLLRLRRSSPALHSGSYQHIPQANEHCLVFVRQQADERYLVIINFSTESQTLNLPDFDQGTVALSSHLDRDGQIMLDHFTLRPHEGCIIKL